jgi:hypothetical protein
MKWEERAALVTKQRYVALVTDDGKRELGRYWVRGDGFEPESTRNNARVRETEDEARHVVLNQVLDRMKGEMAEIGKLWNALALPGEAGPVNAKAQRREGAKGEGLFHVGRGPVRGQRSEVGSQRATVG